MNNRLTKLGILTLFLLVLTLIFMGSASAAFSFFTVDSPSGTIYQSSKIVQVDFEFYSDDGVANCMLNTSIGAYDASFSGVNGSYSYFFDLSSSGPALTEGLYLLTLECNDSIDNISENNFATLVYDISDPVIEQNNPSSMTLGSSDLSFTVNDTVGVDLSSIRVRVTNNDIGASSTIFYSPSDSELICAYDGSNWNVSCDFRTPLSGPGDYEVYIYANDSANNQGTSELLNSVPFVYEQGINSHLVLNSPRNHTAVDEGSVIFSFNIQNEPDFVDSYSCTIYTNASYFNNRTKSFTSAPGSFDPYTTQGFDIISWNVTCYNESYTMQSPNYVVAFENDTVDVQTSQTYFSLEEGLKHYFGFDYLVNSVNLTDTISLLRLNSTVSPVPRNGFGNALSFDGVSGLVSSYNQDDFLFDKDSFSVSLWFRPLVVNTSYLFSSEDSNFSLGVNSSGFIINFTNSSTVTSNIFVPHSMTSIWRNVVLTHNGSELLFYVDGELLYVSAVGSINANTLSRNLAYVGSNANNLVFNGSIDELLIYDRVLSPYEVNLLAGKQSYYDTSAHGDISFFTVTPTNNYWDELNCSLYVNDSFVQDVYVQNGTRYTYKYSILTDDDFDWYVTCDDSYRSASSINRSLVVDYTPIAPLLAPLNSSTSNQTINILGSLGMSGDLTLTSLVQEYFATQTNTSYTIQNYSSYIGGGTITHSVNEYAFRVNRSTLDPGVDAYLSIMDRGYVAVNANINTLFSSATSFNPNLEFIEIVNVTPFQGTFVIELAENMLVNVVPGTSVVFFTESRPLGWFNATFDLLSGLNEMSVEGTIDGYGGPHSSFEIYYDDILPEINLDSWLSAIGKPWSLGFNVSDDYGLDNSSIYAIVNNSLTSRTFNVSNPAEILCSSNSLNASCTLYIPSSISDGFYNVSLFAIDNSGNLGNSSHHEIYIRSTLNPVFEINDTYSNASNATIVVNWNHIPDEHVSYYNLSVTTVPGAANVINWTSVPNTSTNYTFDDEILKDYYGAFLFVEIYPVDVAGVVGPITSTDGLLLVDQTPPIKNNVSIIADRSYWVRSNSQLHLYFNFTDNETGVQEYTYAIGVAPYPLPGWNSIVAETTTNENDFVVTGLNLVQGEYYYVSARARNGYPFLWENSQSQYYSSSSVRVDSIEPNGGSINYVSGPISTGSVLVNYYVGTDSVSGYLNASIMKKTSPLVNGQCGTFSTPYELVGWVSSPGPDSMSVDIQNGLCYIFALYVYDNAGNLDVISGFTTNNISVDQTSPSLVSITVDDGSLTPDTQMSFSWTSSSDLESGIDYYEYAIGTSNNPLDSNEVVDWTTISSVNTSLILSNLNLTHLETYYFKLRAWNKHGLSSTAVSNPITYVDLIVPSPLVVKQVGNDLSSPWVDSNSDGNTTIILTGEAGLASCVWSYYDIEYLNPDSGINYTYSCISDVQGNYTCNISKPDGFSALEEGKYNVYVSCRDQAGNIQRANTNTDITFAKDIGSPLVSVSGLSDGALYSQTPVYINIQEATLDDAYYEVRTGAGLVDSGSLVTGNNSVTLSINPLVAEHWLYVYANDSFGQVNDSTNITFFVNSSIPSGYIYSQKEYINKDTNLTFTMSFFNNYSYFIDGDGLISGDYSGYYSNISNITTFDEFNLQINVSDFTDGNYVATLVVNNSINGTLRSDSYSFDFTIDTAIPEYSDANSPVSVYDNESIDLYITTAEENVSLIFNGTTYYALPVAFGEIVAPEDSNRYWVQIQPNRVNEFMNYVWVIYDLAGNNETVSGSVFVNNRKTTFDDNETDILEFANTDWFRSFDFSDEDVTQNYNDFNCSISHNGSFVLVESPYSCGVRWDDAPYGSYELNITVDEYSNGTFVDTINRTVYVYFSRTDNTTLILNTAHQVQGIILDYAHIMASSMMEANTYTTMSRYGNNLTGLATIDYVGSPQIFLSVDDVVLRINNITGGDVGNFAFKEKTLSTTTYASQSLGLNYRYVPLYSYAINISYPFQTYDFVEFDVSDYDISNVVLYRYDFNFVSNAVDYSSRDIIPIYSLDGEIASYNISNMEGLFVLVDDTCPSPSSFVDGVCVSPEPVTPPIGGGSSSSSGGGFSMPPPAVSSQEDNETNETVNDSEPVNVVTPVASCFDNVKNQDETDVDCGGVCEPCIVEETQNTGETQQSREEVPESNPDTNTKGTTKSKRSFPWWALIALVLIGAGAGVGVVSSRKQTGDVIQQVINSTDARDVVDIANFIQMHELQNRDVQDHELIGMGFSQSKVDLARYAMANEAMVNSVVQYLEQNTSKGYTTDELCNWLVSKDVHQGVVLLAKERFQKPVTSMDSVSESSSKINDSPWDSNSLDKN